MQLPSALKTDYWCLNWRPSYPWLLRRTLGRGAAKGSSPALLRRIFEQPGFWSIQFSTFFITFCAEDDRNYILIFTKLPTDYTEAWKSTKDRIWIDFPTVQPLICARCKFDTASFRSRADEFRQVSHHKGWQNLPLTVFSLVYQDLSKLLEQKELHYVENCCSYKNCDK